MRFPYFGRRDPNKVVNTLWGSQTTFSRCAGFCQRHGKFMTVKQMKQKKCLNKQCLNLAKIETHYYWTYKKTKIELKKTNKNETK